MGEIGKSLPEIQIKLTSPTYLNSSKQALILSNIDKNQLTQITGNMLNWEKGRVQNSFFPYP